MRRHFGFDAGEIATKISFYAKSKYRDGSDHTCECGCDRSAANYTTRLTAYNGNFEGVRRWLAMLDDGLNANRRCGVVICIYALRFFKTETGFGEEQPIVHDEPKSWGDVDLP